MVKEHLVPHFLEYQEVRIQDEVKHIVLGKLRPETHSLFEEMRAQQKLSPIITDIYRQKVEDLQAFYQYRETVLFKVEKESVTPTTSVDTDQLWNFIRNVSLTAEGEVSFAPIGMSFDDELLHSIFLRSMRDVCDEIYLYVDLATQEVKSIVGTSLRA